MGQLQASATLCNAPCEKPNGRRSSKKPKPTLRLTHTRASARSTSSSTATSAQKSGAPCLKMKKAGHNPAFPLASRLSPIASSPYRLPKMLGETIVLHIAVADLIDRVNEVG